MHERPEMQRKFSLGKPERKRSPLQCRNSWKDNIRVDLKETGSQGVE
jgi:hypothetical protein